MSKENRRNIEEAGFVRINGKWRRRCCGICVTSHPTYHLFETHLKESPNCPNIRLIYGEETVREYVRNVNVAASDMRQEYGVDVRCPKEVFPSDFGIQRIQERRMASSMNYQEQESTLSTEEATDSMGINLLRPKLYQYAMLEKRLDSYKTWPSSNPLSPKILAEAGLFYTGKGDSVRCYYCGGGLRNWEEGDSVWVEHVKWYPTCPHVHLVKGASYVKGVKEKRIFTDDGVVMEEIIPAPVVGREDVLLTSIVAESCLANGFDKGLVKTAIRIYIDQFGHSDFRAQDLAEIVFELEENGGVPPHPITCLEENHDGTVEYRQTNLDLQASEGGPQNTTIVDEPEDMQTEAITPAGSKKDSESATVNAVEEELHPTSDHVEVESMQNAPDASVEETNETGNVPCKREKRYENEFTNTQLEFYKENASLCRAQRKVAEQQLKTLSAQERFFEVAIKKIEE